MSTSQHGIILARRTLQTIKKSDVVVGGHPNGCDAFTLHHHLPPPPPPLRRLHSL